LVRGFFVEEVLMSDVDVRLVQALWRVYGRAERPEAWGKNAGNLPYNDPEFSKRMLREHLDDTHGAASRTASERNLQIGWLWEKLDLQNESLLFDVTCGPGLYAVEFAKRGCDVFGVDFAPAGISYARGWAKENGVSEKCRFVEQDVKQFKIEGEEERFDGAILIYGQLAVFPEDEAAKLLTKIAKTLKKGGKLCIELLNPDKVDKENSNWWYTSNDGLWGDKPYLHLGERFWDEEAQTSTERFQILHLESGKMDEIILSDRVYMPAEMTTILRNAGFTQVQIYPAWGGLPLYDADEWLVYIAEK
jgi:SAM-dependent methyltransferase